MPEILWSMIKEEWRIHSTMFGSLMFALFPAIMALFSFWGAFLLPIFEAILPARQIALFVQYAFVFLGVSVGAFGLMGREVMNRRFGSASLIAYSSRTLPVSEKEIFLNFFVKDVIYYFALWILPAVAGFALASAYLSVSLAYAFGLLLALSLSFMIGLSAAFFLSTVYANSRRLLFGFIVLSLAAFWIFSDSGIIGALPSFSFFIDPSPESLALSLAMIIIPTGVSFLFLKTEYPEKKQRFENSIGPISEKMKFTGFSNFVSKDFLDMSRSEGGAGKILFSFIFPLAILRVLLFVFLKFVPALDFLLMFSIFLGIVSTTIYNWLTEFDSFTSYAFLPVKVSEVIKSKIASHVIINVVSVAILLIVAAWTGEYSRLPYALVSFLSIAAYGLAVTIYLGGLYPNVLFYSAKILASYLVFLVPVLLLFIFALLINPAYLALSPILIAAAYFIVQTSYKKWNSWENPAF